MFCFLVLAHVIGIDVTKSQVHVPIMQGYFNFYPDSNVFLYRTNVALTRDTEVFYPRAFKIKLPKGLKFYELGGSADFCFYYNKGQAIFIKTDLDNKTVKKDTFYSPQKEELSDFILYKTFTSNHKYNIKEILMKENRNQLFIRKGTITILLYNIEPKNYDLFFKYTNDFSFL